MKNILVFFVTFLLVNTAQAGLFGSDTYEECIIDNMKGVQSDVAASQIAAACRRKFPSPEKPKEDTIFRIKSKELQLITGVAFIQPGNFFGTINNGIDNILITSVDVKITNAHKEEDYRVTIYVPPLSSKDFSVRISEEFVGESKWSITGAEGRAGGRR